MAPVESFIPTSESKKTIEKPVKQKPSLKELVKIESPGKPMPASRLEKKPRAKRSAKSKRKKRSKASPEATRQIPTKKDTTLIIT